MKKEGLVFENLCDEGSGIWMDEGTKITMFGEVINQNQYQCLPSIFREPFNEIHRNICPNLCREWERVQAIPKGFSFHPCGTGRYHIQPPFVEFPFSFPSKNSYTVPSNTF